MGGVHTKNKIPPPRGPELNGVVPPCFGEKLAPRELKGVSGWNPTRFTPGLVTPCGAIRELAK